MLCGQHASLGGGWKTRECSGIGVGLLNAKNDCIISNFVKDCVQIKQHNYLIKEKNVFYRILSTMLRFLISTVFNCKFF